MTKDHRLVALGERIAKLRDRRGMSAVEMAEEMSMAKSYVSAIEHGRVNLTFRQMVRISTALGCNLSTLVRGIE